ncbi:integrin alpha [Nitrosomonas sp. Nm166]|uniref:beta strand repeat-containing protein n=1 Tax=Nitrosomonas sp. Nm166 TaxID=1881054 RepID=UPI0008EE42DB|nr:integrin alpha [Nitrosomonas sp. Nm166]SFF14555.1 FG-GAP repeat-containing protein [Nitrosomonas sp. Nm166]
MAVSIIKLSSNLSGSNGFRVDGVTADDSLGFSVSNAGDVNGDGFDDVIVGSPRADSSGDDSGSSYVVFGKAAGFSATPDLSSLDGSNGFRLDGVAAGDFSGGSVSSAGDVNGDGFADLIVSSSGADPNGSNSGSSYVVFGRASGFAATLNLSGLDGSNGFRMDGVGADDRSGGSVSSSGDVNGDGFDDVIIGASGSSYVVFGKAAGFSATINLSNIDGSNGFRLDAAGLSVSNAGDVNSDGFDDVIIVTPDADPNGERSGSSYVVFGKDSGFTATMDLSSLDGSNGFRVDGVPEQDFFSGFSVSTAGDVNNDGFDDVIIGARGADPNGDYSGSSYVVFGKASGFTATMDLSSLDGNNGFRLDGAFNYDLSGTAVSTAGDVNGDGFDDLIIGAPSLAYYGDSGHSYVVFGKASGFNAAMNLSSLDGNNGFLLEGEVLGAAGSSVSSAGDVNGDGFDDLMVGEPNADRNNVNSGSSYVVFGGDFLNEVIFLGTPGDDTLTGTAAAERFEGGDGNDTLNGQGGADVFRGDAGDDNIRLIDLSFQSLDGGTGNDILILGRGFGPLDLDLDLASMRGKISGIEIIDLIGSDSDITLTLTALDLINLSDTSNILTVNGNEGSRVVGLTEGWADGGIDGNYHIYTNGEAVLRVDTDVSTDWPAPGVISLADLDGSNGFRLDGVAAYDFSGGPASSAGDVNGDGFDDVIVGARYADPNGTNSGSSYVVFGKASGFSAAMDLSRLDGSNGFRLDGVAAFDYSGAVRSAGDVNGDGFDDVIVGAPGNRLADPNGYSSGSSYVVFGKASGFSAAIDLSNLDGSNGFRLDGEAEGDESGFSVSNAGDINGDGFDDVIIGAPYADPNGYSSGSSCVVFGKASGFSAAIDLSNLDGSNGFRLGGEAEGDRSGTSVSDAGDVNGDGFNDVIVGAFVADPNGYSSGSSYVVFGKASGFDAVLDLSSLDGNNGFRLDGEAADDFSGSSVSSAGDVNSDGFDDVIIGAFGADPNGDRSGSSYVVFGKASGFSATLDLSSLDGSNGFRLDGLTADDSLGLSVSNAGDFNGDSFEDLIVGAPGTSPNGSYSGSSYVVLGKASGFDATIDLSSLDGKNGLRLDGGPGAFDFSGLSVSSAGDVNNDGFDDLIIGASGADPNGESSGSSYVVFGRSSFTDDGVIRGTPGDDILTGTSEAERFKAGDGNDRMIGRGGADEFLGEAGNDYIRISDLDFESVDGGIGNDTLALGGSGLNLNLTDMAGKISGIETIRLFGTGDNTLTLTAADVLNLSDTTNTLRVNGNASDRIVGLSHGWGDGGVHGDFHTFFNDAAVLLVGVDVATDFV